MVKPLYVPWARMSTVFNVHEKPTPMQLSPEFSVARKAHFECNVKKECNTMIRAGNVENAKLLGLIYAEYCYKLQHLPANDLGIKILSRKDIDCFGIQVDSLNLFERIAMLKHTFASTVIYTLSDQLLCDLYWLTGEPIERLKTRLQANCKKYNISYSVLSMSINSGFTTAFEDIPGEIFLGLSDCLDYFFMDITSAAKAEKNISFGENQYSIADLGSNKLTPANKIKYSIAYMLANVNKKILEWLKSIYTTKWKQAETRLSSQGLDNLVFTAKDISKFEDVTFNLSADVKTVLHPIKVFSNGYLTELETWKCFTL